MRRSLFSLLARIITVSLVTAGAILSAAGPAAHAQEAEYDGKTITMIVGNPAGGTADLAGRFMAQFLTKYLPGNPAIVVRNIPGADGKVGMNYFVRQAKPDGLMIATGVGSPLDPRNYRDANTLYDPLKFHFIGGVSRGGTFQVVNKSALPRLTDKMAPPVTVGAIDGTRSGEQVISWGIELLGWNAKWVVGYRASTETTIALERGEVDLTSSGSSTLVRRLTETGKFQVLCQSGIVADGKMRRRSDFADVPTMAEFIAGKLTDPVARDAFSYLEAMTSMDPWMALPPDTPPSIVATYRETFKKATADPEFLEKGKRISEDIRPMFHADFELLVKTAADRLTPAADAYIKTLQVKQGIRAKE